MSILEAIQMPCQSNLDGTTGHLFLMLINALMGTQCSLGSKGNYPPDSTHKLKNGDKFDFIVVGAGSSGSVLANRLLENPEWKVLVLEAGDYPSATSEVPALLFNLQGTTEDWQYKTEKTDTSCKGYKDEYCRWPRGKALGGSSTINAMLHIRGNARDFDDWENLGNQGWDYNEIERHFRELENVQSGYMQDFTAVYGEGGYHNISWYNNGEPISDSIINGVKELGISESPKAQDPRKPIGYYQAMMSIGNGVRMNAAKTFLSQSKHKENLSLVTKAYVKQLIVSEDRLTVRGVEVKVGDNNWSFFAQKEVILSAGALNSPQILLHSGIGPKNDLEALSIGVIKDLPGVGHNLQDHVTLPIYYKVNPNAYNKNPEGYFLDELYSYFKSRTGPLGTIHMTNLNGFINTKKYSNDPNIQILHVGYQKGDKFLLPQTCKSFGYKDEITKHLLTNVNSSPMISFHTTVLNPKSKGYLKLKSGNVFESAKFYSGYFEDLEGEDMKTMLEGIQFLKDLMETSSMKKYNGTLVTLPLPECNKHNIDSNEYWKCYIYHLGTSLYHQVGTVKMGPSNDKMAVVDERLRVHGIKALRIIDASIMPSVTSGNTNAPCLVIGHKGGKMILEDWRDKPSAIINEEL